MAQYCGRTFAGDLANVGNVLYQAFNERLVEALRGEIHDKHDIICLPFGRAHDAAMVRFEENTKVETGIGYPDTCAAFRTFKVYESSAWMHWHIGKSGAGVGYDYDRVIPNYFDVEEWPLSKKRGRHLLYFGRLIQSKGLDIIAAIAKARPDLTIVLCGQGDPTPWLSAGIVAIDPVQGRVRAEILGEAMAVLMPTRYIEPFGGVTVEANLCGTPVLGSDFGSFTETIDNGVNGYRCNTLGDFLAAIERVESGALRASVIRKRALRYDMYALAPRYDAVFRQLDDLWGDGYFARRSAIGPIANATPMEVT